MEIGTLTSAQLRALEQNLAEAQIALIAAMSAFDYLERKMTLRKPLWVRVLSALGIRTTKEAR